MPDNEAKQSLQEVIEANEKLNKTLVETEKVAKAAEKATSSYWGSIKRVGKIASSGISDLGFPIFDVGQRIAGGQGAGRSVRDYAAEVREQKIAADALGKSLERVGKSVGSYSSKIESGFKGASKWIRLAGDDYKQFGEVIESLAGKSSKFATSFTSAARVMRVATHPIVTSIALISLAYDQLSERAISAYNSIERLDKAVKTSFGPQAQSFIARAQDIGAAQGMSTSQVLRGFGATGASGFNVQQSTDIVRIAAAFSKEQGKEFEKVLENVVNTSRIATEGMTNEQRNQWLQRQRYITTGYVSSPFERTDVSRSFERAGVGFRMAQGVFGEGINDLLYQTGLASPYGPGRVARAAKDTGQLGAGILSLYSPIDQAKRTISTITEGIGGIAGKFGYEYYKGRAAKGELGRLGEGSIQIGQEAQRKVLGYERALIEREAGRYGRMSEFFGGIAASSAGEKKFDKNQARLRQLQEQYEIAPDKEKEIIASEMGKIQREQKQIKKAIYESDMPKFISDFIGNWVDADAMSKIFKKVQKSKEEEAKRKGEEARRQGIALGEIASEKDLEKEAKELELKPEEIKKFEKQQSRYLEVQDEIKAMEKWYAKKSGLSGKALEERLKSDEEYVKKVGELGGLDQDIYGTWGKDEQGKDIRVTEGADKRLSAYYQKARMRRALANRPKVQASNISQLEADFRSLAARGVLSDEDSKSISKIMISDTELTDVTNQEAIADILKNAQIKRNRQLQEVQTAFVPQERQLAGQNIGLAARNLQFAGGMSETEVKRLYEIIKKGDEVSILNAQKLLEISQKRFELAENNLMLEKQSIAHAGDKERIGLSIMSARRRGVVGIDEADFLYQRGQSDREDERQNVKQILAIKEQAYQDELNFTIRYTQARMDVIKSSYDNQIQMEKSSLQAKDRQLAPGLRMGQEVYGIQQFVNSIRGNAMGIQEQNLGIQRQERAFGEQKELFKYQMLGIPVPPHIQRRMAARGMREAEEDFRRRKAQQKLMEEDQRSGFINTFDQLREQGITVDDLRQSEGGRQFMMGLLQQSQGAFTNVGLGKWVNKEMQDLAKQQQAFSVSRFASEQKMRALEGQSLQDQIAAMERETGKLRGPMRDEARLALAGKYKEAAQYSASIGDTEKMGQYQEKAQEIFKTLPDQLKAAFEDKQVLTNQLLREQNDYLMAIGESLGARIKGPSLLEGEEGKGGMNSALSDFGTKATDAADKFLKAAEKAQAAAETPVKVVVTLNGSNVASTGARGGEY